ncbi:MAG: NAD-dependent epimerase/dehydratase family protein, partial [Bacilli bacterium]|nr:NAD-dependent epimerase/dehydratase family protein [Bacilli bacterium]
MRKYFITGISGFLGRNLVLSIKKRGDYHIYGLALKGDPAFKLYEDDPDVTLIEGDILDPSSLDRFLIEADRNSYFIHSAGRVSVLGKNDPLTTRINYDGTISVVEALKKRGIHRLLFVSSVDALSIEEGKETIEPTSFDPDIGMGVYGKSKAKAGNYVLEQCKNNGLPAIIVCPSAILGPEDPFSAPMND